jgi:hypothetical protein
VSTLKGVQKEERSARRRFFEESETKETPPTILHFID